MTKGLQESDLFEPVKKWLEEREYEVFSEVEVPSASGRIDVVGKKKPAYCAVEMKTSLSLELVDQAVKRRQAFHYIYIAIPKRKKEIPFFIERILMKEKIGILLIDVKYGNVSCCLPARFNRPIFSTKYSKLESILTEEHKTWLKGGSNGGGYVTPYKLTMERVKEYLYGERYKWASVHEGDEGWRSINNILDHCETHYGSPKSSLSNALRKFEEEWCESMVIGRKLHYRFKGAKDRKLFR